MTVGLVYDKVIVPSGYLRNALAGSMELAFNVSLSFYPAIIAGLRTMVGGLWLNRYTYLFVFVSHASTR